MIESITQMPCMLDSFQKCHVHAQNWQKFAYYIVVEGRTYKVKLDDNGSWAPPVLGYIVKTNV